MVAGEMVNGIGAAITTSFTFQPAATTAFVITNVNGNGTYSSLTDGVKTALTLIGPSSTDSTAVNIKLFIDNSIYLIMDPIPGVFCAFSGMQIK
tara:strand:- start:84 stop:365 length:282 start_codon:yes stop_codon:yes gene_type:complete